MLCFIAHSIDYYGHYGSLNVSPRNRLMSNTAAGVVATTSSRRKVALKLKKQKAKLKQQRLRLLENYAVYADAIVNLLAMIGFIIGSLFFIPTIEHKYAPSKYIGEYLFAIASFMVFYLNANDLLGLLKSSSPSSRHNNTTVVIKKSNRASGAGVSTRTTTSVEDHFEQQQSQDDTKHQDQRSDKLAAVFYIMGALLYTIGSILFIWFPLSGGWCFIIGSLFFVIGAFVNSLQIWDSPDRKSAQMANTMVMSDTIGYTMFFVASIPYGFIFECTGEEIYTDSAVFFLLGSILCTVTAALDIRRLQYIKKQKLYDDDDDDDDDDMNTKDFGSSLLAENNEK